MKIDRNTKTPLYSPKEVPQKLRDFYAETLPATEAYRKGYDNIKWENANEQRNNKTL